MRIIQSFRLAAVAGIALGLAACSQQAASTSATATPEATAAATDLATPSETAVPAAGGTPGVGWDMTARDYRGKDGQRWTFTCGPQGSPRSVWGTDIYTDDSSVCTAAVHAGLITLQDGGSVVIEIRPGLDSYKGSTRNGITTGDWGSWFGSYVFPTPASPVPQKPG